METAILWFGFIGAWLLFAGPIYQAALELMDQDIEFERIKGIGDTVTAPSNISPFWWFLPPVKLYLEHRRSDQYRKRYFQALLPEDVEALIAFMGKATGWFMVALGGLCIAIKETFELCHAYEVASWQFALIVLGMGFLSMLHTVLRVKRSSKIISAARS